MSSAAEQTKSFSVRVATMDDLPAIKALPVSEILSLVVSCSDRVLNAAHYQTVYDEHDYFLCLVDAWMRDSLRTTYIAVDNETGCVVGLDSVTTSEDAAQTVLFVSSSLNFHRGYTLNSRRRSCWLGTGSACASATSRRRDCSRIEQNNKKTFDGIRNRKNSFIG